MIPPHQNQKPKKTASTSWQIFVDGASRGNPGDAGAGIYITHDADIVVAQGFYLGKRTNNQAEYIALILALALVKNRSDDQDTTPFLAIYSDSELLIKQMKGAYKIKNPELIKLKAIIDALLQETAHSFKHVRRTYNHQADALANQGINEKTKIPLQLIQIIKRHMPL
jgi:ribonuclease HI